MPLFTAYLSRFRYTVHCLKIDDFEQIRPSLLMYKNTKIHELKFSDQRLISIYQAEKVHTLYSRSVWWNVWNGALA